MRITGGIHRSRAIVAPRGVETRPTSDRVREALFSMLVSDGVFQEPPRVLDVYAGSGALGFEAISRGAREVVFVENARPALTAIRDNAQALDVLDLVTVMPIPAARALKTLEGPFDLVLLDPPYADVKTAAFADVLTMAAGLVADEGVLLLEHAASDTPEPPPGLALDRCRRHGDTSLSLFRAHGGRAPELVERTPNNDEPHK